MKKSLKVSSIPYIITQVHEIHEIVSMMLMLPEYSYITSLVLRISNRTLVVVTLNYKTLSNDFLVVIILKCKTSLC